MIWVIGAFIYGGIALAVTIFAHAEFGKKESGDASVALFIGLIWPLLIIAIPLSVGLSRLTSKDKP